MTTHTPGPWHVRPPTDVMHAVCRPSGSIVADIGYSSTLEENDANGLLIAAAPDLLEAVRIQHDIIDRLLAMLITADPTFRPTKSEIWDLIKTVSAPQLISKATGTA